LVLPFNFRCLAVLRDSFDLRRLSFFVRRFTRKIGQLGDRRQGPGLEWFTMIWMASIFTEHVLKLRRDLKPLLLMYHGNEE
jgi:hypothetical protein